MINTSKALAKQNNMVGSWIKTEEENKLVLSQYGSKIAELENPNALMELLGKWRYYVGIKQDPTPEEFIIISKFIRSNFGDLTLDEIDLAIELSVMGKLNIDNVAYNQFSVLYVVNILNSYKEYRHINMLKILDVREKELIKEREANRYTPEYKLNNMKQLFIDQYAEFKEKGAIFDYFNSCYNYLKKNNYLIIDKQTKEEAVEYGKRTIKKEKDSKIGLYLIKTYTKEEMEKVYMRNYCVQKFFNTITDINEFVKTFKLEHFQ